MFEAITTNSEGQALIRADGEGEIAKRENAWNVFFPDHVPSNSPVINEQTALTYSAVWGCIAVIVEAIGVMGWHLFKRQDDGGRMREPTHNVDRLISTRPNPDMSSQTFRETQHANTLLFGNSYAEIERDNMSRPVALWPLNPGMVKPMRNVDGDIVYEVKQPAGEPRIVLALDMFHLHGLGFDGIQGYSVIRMARQSIRMGKAAETFGASWFENGTRPGGVLQHPGHLSIEAQDRLRATWNKQYQGASKAGGVAVIEEGMTWQPMSIPPDDAQFLESRIFQVDELCRWFRVPKFLLQNLEDATLRNVEEMYLQFGRGTLLPWARKWEAEADYKLLSAAERPRLFTKINLDTLQRASLVVRNKSQATGRQWGWLSADDVRRMENMNPLPNNAGQIYLVPVNMVNADTLLNGDSTDDTAGRPPTRAQAKLMLDAQGPVFTEAARRLIGKESKAARRAAAKHEDDPQAFEAWADKFYTVHAKDWRDAMAVPVGALVMLVAGETVSDTTVEAMETIVTVCAGHQIERSRTELAVAFATNEVAALCDQWEEDRPKDVTMALGQQAIQVAVLASLDKGTDDDIPP